ncbi:MAG: response regulator [Verrucomicrobiota bacterium]
MSKPIDVLLLEDQAPDAELLIQELRRAGFTPRWKRVYTEPDFLAEIANLPDIILSDYSMPQFSGLRAAELLQQSGLNIPFILISGTVGEEIAVAAMQHGATDYLLKDRIGRLGIAVERALEQKRLRSERDHAESALLKAGALQNAIFNSANFSSIATDAKGVIQIFNVGAERMLGYTAAEVMNRITPAEISDPQEVIARATALSVELGTSITPGFEALVFKASRGIEDIYELTYIRKDGSRFPAVVSVTALRDGQGGIIGYLLIGTDNTARRRADEELQWANAKLKAWTAALNSFAIVAETDTQGRITYVNDPFCSISQYSREELLGKNHREVANSGHHSREFWKEMWGTISRGRIWRGEIKNHAKDGTDFWVDTVIVPLLGANGRPETYPAIRFVTTERKRFEQALQETNVELEGAKSAAEKANLAKSEFLSSMSHELRTPLNAILGFAQLMEYATPGPTVSQTKSIDQILQAGWYLLELINEVLDLAVIESGKVSLSEEAVSLSELMSECRSMMEPQAQERGIRMTFPWFATPVFVSADRTRLKQIVINLLSNAVKYNKEQGTVIVDCTASGPGRIRISVRDTGAGLGPEKLAELFIPFHRLGQEAGSVAGTGIGLVVSKRLAELMGGAIGVESTVGAGSLFWCEMISAAAPRITVADREAGGLLHSEVSSDVLRRTLLYVEDNPANLQLVEELIAGFPALRLVTAVNGPLGIERARTAQPEVILMDINLPGFSGITALKILREEAATAHIPVIALSANAMPRDIEKGLEGGFFRYLTKPIRIKELMETLNEALAFAEGQRAVRGGEAELPV